MAIEAIEPAPYRNPVVNKDALMTPAWVRWHELALIARVSQTPTAVVPVVVVDGVSASIPLTPLLPSANGVYRVAYYARIHTPATTSSLLQLGLAAIETGVTVTQTSAAATANTITTVLAGTWIQPSTAGGPLSYFTTYASVGATAMVYAVAFWVEQIG